MVQETKPEAQNHPAAAQTGVATVRALILTGFGINCEEEFAAAYQLAGAVPTVVHLNQVLHGQVSIHDFDILNFPGGFSFGDDLGSGVVLANKLRYRQTGAGGRTLLDDIKDFIAAGKFVLGICNGFQVLVKLGLLPNLGGNVVPEVTLTHNASGRYEDRWVRLRVNPLSKTPFLQGIDTLEVPVRHGEGRLVVPNDDVRQAIAAAGLNCLSYVDANGDGTSVYPHNPNGAELNCAGLCDPTGQVFGLMPHPEAFLSGYNHPDWGRRERRDEGDGLRIFRNIVGYISQLRLMPPAGQPHPPAPSPAGEGEQLVMRQPLQHTLQQPLQQALTAAVGEGDTSNNSLRALVEEERPYYERRRRRSEDLHTSIAENVFTAGSGKWQKLKEYGLEMRQAPTPAEDTLWQAVRGQKLGVAFRRQHAIAGYIVDFVTLADKLIVELDGAIHTEAEQADYDHGRTQLLEEYGYQVLRFTNAQVIHQLPAVVQTIQANLAASG